MQVLAFSKLYEKSKDTDTSPAAESIEKTQIRLKQPFTVLSEWLIKTRKIWIRFFRKRAFVICMRKWDIGRLVEFVRLMNV